MAIRDGQAETVVKSVMIWPKSKDFLSCLVLSLNQKLNSIFSIFNRLESAAMLPEVSLSKNPNHDLPGVETAEVIAINVELFSYFHATEILKIRKFCFDCSFWVSFCSIFGLHHLSLAAKCFTLICNSGL